MSKKNRGAPLMPAPPFSPRPPPGTGLQAAPWRQEMESWVLTIAPPGFAPHKSVSGEQCEVTSPNSVIAQKGNTKT